MAVTWAKMQGRLNYIELRVVTQRTYPARESWQIYSTTFWLRLILKNRRHSKLRSHPRSARAFWHVRVDHIYLPHVFTRRTLFPVLSPLSSLVFRVPCSVGSSFPLFFFYSFLPSTFGLFPFVLSPVAAFPISGKICALRRNDAL